VICRKWSFCDKNVTYALNVRCNVTDGRCKQLQHKHETFKYFTHIAKIWNWHSARNIILICLMSHFWIHLWVYVIANNPKSTLPYCEICNTPISYIFKIKFPSKYHFWIHGVINATILSCRGLIQLSNWQ
jgi:hypothetical protein